MTDYPAVVYLKADICCKEVDSWKKEDRRENVKSVKKKTKEHKASARSRKRVESYKKLLEVLNNVILKKMDKIDGRLDILSESCDILGKKVDTLSSLSSSTIYHCNGILEKSSGSSIFIKNNLSSPVSSNVVQITLNTKDDFPDGSWLGFENNPEMRVRCKISRRDLHQINRKFVTPEKMALALLDLLFDRETQACSNISGLGKLKKKQLDPLLIYGIRCHLMYRFGISEEDWNKVKISIDSKCRTAFRRKLKGLSLSPRNYGSTNVSDSLDSASMDSKHSNSSNVHTDKEMNCGDLSFQSEDDESRNALTTLMEIILS